MPLFQLVICLSIRDHAKDCSKYSAKAPIEAAFTLLQDISKVYQKFLMRYRTLIDLHGMTLSFLSDRNHLRTHSNVTWKHLFSQHCRLVGHVFCYVLLSSSISSLCLLPVLGCVNQTLYCQNARACVCACVRACVRVRVRVCVCVCVCRCKKANREIM